MKPSADFFRKIYPFSVLIAVLSLLVVWHFSPRAESAQVVEKNRAELLNYDIRTDKSEAQRTITEKFVADAGKTINELTRTRKEMMNAGKDLQSRLPFVKVEFSEITRNAEVISPDFALEPRFLTAPTGEKRVVVLKNFLKGNNGLIGLDETEIESLKTTADYTNPDGVLSYVTLEQEIGGIPVFQGELRAGFTKRGELFRVVNNLLPAPDEARVSKEFGDAEPAVKAAARAINRETNENDLKRLTNEPNDLKISFASGQFTDATTAQKIYFPVDAGVARPAWRVILWTKEAAFDIIVDAADGTLFWRQNITSEQTQTATYEVYGSQTSVMKTADSPTPNTPGCIDPGNCPPPPMIARQSFTLIGNEPPYNFNNNGWIPDGENRTIGNAAEAGIDRDGTQGIDPNGWAFGNPNRNFVYVYNPAPGLPPPGEEPLPPTQTYPPSQFQQGSITNAFYTANRWHDETYRLGFTEQARNFQTDNFGRGGFGNDSISVEVQDSSGTNSANFSTPPDGSRPRAQFFIWTASTPDRDGALDNQVVVHELTHGLTQRLHSNGVGLSTNMAGGINEGWSDFYALSLLSEPADNVNGLYVIGCYITNGLTTGCYYGIRRFPVARISVLGPNGLPHNPLTFRYINADCNTLIGTTTTNPNSAFPRGPIGVSICDQVHNLGEIWSSTLWEVRGFLIDTHGAAEGNRRALQYSTDGMKLAPVSPTFLQERDAIIAAAAAANPGDVTHVRRGFAVRGMGYYARIINTGSGSNNTQVVEDFSVLGNATIASGFSVSDAPGDGDGFPESGEPLTLTVPLTNASTGGTLTGVSVEVVGGGTASYGDIAEGQTVTRNIDFTVPVMVPCGVVNYTITFKINSSAGQRTETRTIRVGAPIGSPVTFANTTPVTIPNSGASTPYGTSINVSGLTGPKTIKLEITGLTHSFPSDLDYLLVGPGGQKFSLLSDSGSAGAVSNLTFTLSDAAETQPSITQWTAGDFKPVNITIGDTFPAPAPNSPYSEAPPAGTSSFSSVFGNDGLTMNGTWTLYLVDDTVGDFGTQTGWKLIFESAQYVCDYFNNRTRADFDGDGKSDMSVYRPSEGNWYMSHSTAGFGVMHWGLSEDILAPGDFDGDGKTDFAIFRPATDSSASDFYVLKSSGLTFTGYSWGLPGDVPVIEDYDGDGKDDIAVFRQSNHTFYVHKSTGGNPLIFSNIESGMPVAGDFDGDGKGDFASYSQNGWYLAPSGTNYSPVSFTRWGTDGDNPVPADYDGDGRDDFAVFRPSDRTWYILKSNGGIDYVQFGLSTDIPVPADYDGDGKADVAVYRDGTWYINRSATGMMIAQFGLSSDKPVQSEYIP